MTSSYLYSSLVFNYRLPRTEPIHVVVQARHIDRANQRLFVSQLIPMHIEDGDFDFVRSMPANFPKPSVFVEAYVEKILNNGLICKLAYQDQSGEFYSIVLSQTD